MRAAVSRSAPVCAIPTSNGPPMAGPASIRTRRASEKASGRLQTGKRRQLPAKDSGGLPQPERRTRSRRSYHQRRHLEWLELRHQEHGRPLAAQPGFSDDMSPAPTIGANVAVSYALTPGASLYLPGSFDRAFHSRGDKERHNFATSEIESFVSRKRGGVTAWTMLVWDSATTIKWTLWRYPISEKRAEAQSTSPACGGSLVIPEDASMRSSQDISLIMFCWILERQTLTCAKFAP